MYVSRITSSYINNVICDIVCVHKYIGIYIKPTYLFKLKKPTSLLYTRKKLYSLQ